MNDSYRNGSVPARVDVIAAFLGISKQELAQIAIAAYPVSLPADALQTAVCQLETALQPELMSSDVKAACVRLGSGEEFGPVIALALASAQAKRKMSDRVAK